MKNGLQLLLLLCVHLSFDSSCNAANVFQYCDNVYNLNPGYTYVESPYYPAYYPANSACRYILKAPTDYTIRATCEVDTNKGTDRCTTENVYVSVDGDPQLRGTENFCGNGTFTRTSIFNNFVLAYISQGSWGRFRCQLYVAPQPCDCGWSVNQKIANGVQANINEFPSVVALIDKSSGQSASFCGGTIVSHRFVMTAAHCAEIQSNPANLQVLVGDHDLTKSTETLYADMYDILQIIIHPNYASMPQIINDIALLRTVKDIQWTRGVGPICIPPANVANKNYDYLIVTIAGWGTTSFSGPTSNVLLKAEVYTTTNAVCQNNYGSEVQIFNSEICTLSNYKQDTCQYDSGGPVIYRSMRQFQLGIISFGKPCGIETPTIGVNTRVTSYGAWINQTVGYTLCAKQI